VNNHPIAEGNEIQSRIDEDVLFYQYHYQSLTKTELCETFGQEYNNKEGNRVIRKRKTLA
jgi:hypothetical protein